MTDDSFTYNGQDVHKLASLRIVHTDVFMAPLRPRKVTIPQRSGAYDYGAKYHDERELTMTCTIENEITEAQFDALKYLLSRKGRIMLWDKQDRYYIGQCYNAAQVLDYYRHCMRDFELTFVCEPYAYALEPTEIKTEKQVMPIQYIGTRQVPTRITIRNIGSTPITGLMIIARERSN